MKQRFFKKEFILYTDSDIQSLYFEALPSIGRYFRKDCQKLQDGIFRVVTLLPEGDLFYNFKDGVTHEIIAPGNDNYQEGSRNWRYCKLGTDDPLPVKFLLNSAFCSPISEEWYEIRIIACQEWIKQVIIQYYGNDDCLLGEAAPETCFTYKELRYLRYLIPSKAAPGRRFCFEIHGNQQVYYFGANRKLSKSQPPLFQLPAGESPPTSKNPLLQSGMVYHIFPDTFYRAPESKSYAPNNTPLREWHAPPLPGAFFGGNLKGIYHKLDYLEELKVSYLYLTPIFPANSNHRYDCRTFQTIDPLLGSPEEFETLITACHSKGIKVILDAIINHCGTDFWAFQDLLTHQENSIYKNWFIINKFPIATTPDAPPNYSCWWNIGSLPQFNLENPEVVSYLLEVYSTWVTHYKIDGVRIDVASEIGYPMLRQFTDHLKKIRADILIIGEIWGEPGQFMQHGLFDGVTNYQLRQNAFIAYFITKNIGLAELANFLFSNYFSLPFPRLLQSWNLLDSHDTPRFSSLIDNERKLHLAVFLQMLLPGSPVVYYGDEIGLKGRNDPDNRRCMAWDQLPGNALFDWYQRLTSIRNQERALQKGDFAILEASNESGLLIISRCLNTETIYGIANFESNRSSGNVMESIPSGHYLELITERVIQNNLILEPNQACILKKQDTQRESCPGKINHPSRLENLPKNNRLNLPRTVIPSAESCIIHIAAEVAPFSKRGGLGDVVGSLPVYLSKESGRKNLIFSPYYHRLTGALVPVCQGAVDFNGINCEYIVLKSDIAEVDFYFIQLEEAYCMDDVYPDGAQPYQTEVGLFYFIFGKCIIDFLVDFQIKVGTIITHDWHAAGIYPYLAQLSASNGNTVNTIHVIHNYHYQGEIYYNIHEFLEPEVITHLEKQFQETGYCAMSSIAVLEANRLITVSPTYAFELQSQIAPHPGLELFTFRKNRISGILNGIDDTTWNPSSDSYLPQPYDALSLERKDFNKNVLLKKLGFAVSNLPLAVFISRLTTQKGIDLLVDLKTGRPFDIYDRMERFLAKGLLLVIYGAPNGGANGDINLQLNALQERFPSSFRYISQYTEELAHQLFAGADLLLQPSRFEPCGLTQMYAMKYGTIPVVTPVGGLKDTVLDFNKSPEAGTGFLMDNFSFSALNEALDRALTVYHDPMRWNELVKRCMLQDNSWSIRVSAYLELLA